MNKVVWNEEGHETKAEMLHTYELGFLDCLVLTEYAKRKPALAAALKALMAKAEVVGLAD